MRKPNGKSLAFSILIFFALLTAAFLFIGTSLGLRSASNIAFSVICSVLVILAGMLFTGTNLGFNLALNSKKSTIDDLNLGGDQYSKDAYAKISKNESMFNSLHYETIHMKSDDGLTLTGYFVPAEGSSDKLAVLAHGFAVDAKNTGDLACFFHSQGFHVFAADDRAHGKSEGKYRGMGWLDRKDYLKWIDLLIHKLGKDVQIVLQGASMGGATVMMLSGEELPANVKAIIEDCGYTSAKEEFLYQVKRQFPRFPKFLVNLVSLESKIRAGYGLEEASALKQVKKSKVPIFFIHGDGDTFVPVEMVYKLHDAATCEKQLWVVPGAEHGLSYNIATEEYEEKIKQFYNKYIN
jgi:Prolyl oligopeptidase family.